MANYQAQTEQLSKKINLSQQVISIAVTIITTMIVVYGFFYNMFKTIEYHTNQIKELQVQIDEMHKTSEETAVFKGVSDITIKNLENKVGAIEAKMDRIDEKIDKILIRK